MPGTQDGDVITATLYASQDGLTDWTVLATAPGRDGLLLWDTSELADGAYQQLRLTVSDPYSVTVVQVPGVVVAANRGNHAPGVEIIGPDLGSRSSASRVRWIAEDSDGDDLDIDIMWSSDAGLTWGACGAVLVQLGRVCVRQRCQPGWAEPLASDRVRRRLPDARRRGLSITASLPANEAPELEILAPVAGASVVRAAD